MAVGLVGQAGTAWAEPPGVPVFDEVGYSTCTAVAPAPVLDRDAVATTCCVDNGGVPFGTRYGVGCVKQVVDPEPDYRPTIYMPTWPSEIGPDDAALDELAKLPPLP